MFYKSEREENDTENKHISKVEFAGQSRTSSDEAEHRALSEKKPMVYQQPSNHSSKSSADTKK